MSDTRCDVCGAEVFTPGEFDEHNRQNYVLHVFLSHPKEADRIAIIQSYIDRFVTD